MTKTLVSRLRDEYVQQSSRCGEEDSQERALLAQEAADEIERLEKTVRGQHAGYIAMLDKAAEMERRLAAEPSVHASDCATNNAPALPTGPCNCGQSEKSNEQAAWACANSHVRNSDPNCRVCFPEKSGEQS